MEIRQSEKVGTLKWHLAGGKKLQIAEMDSNI